MTVVSAARGSARPDRVRAEAVNPPPPTELHRRAAVLLGERVRAVFKEMPKALAGDAEAVHQLRVGGRRLRVALPLLAARPEGKRARRSLAGLRTLVRTAGVSRDFDVSLELFGRLLATDPAPADELRELRKRLCAARRRSRLRLADALLDLDLAGLRRDLRRLQARGPGEPPAIMLRLMALRDEEGAAALTDLAGLGERYDAEALHDLRRRLRRLRYAAEVCDAVRGEKSPAPKLFKQLQEELGELHDRHVLGVWLARQSARAVRRSQPALAAAAQQLGESCENGARAAHGVLLAGQPEARIREALRHFTPVLPALELVAALAAAP